MTSRRKDKGKRLSVLTDAEKFALYGLPDFDEGQQLKYFSLTAEELATSRPGILAQIYCILQMGYFKAKHAFFHFSFTEGRVCRCRWAKIQRRTSDDQSPCIKKYFGPGKSVVAYPLLCNHIPLNSYLIGAHEYEAHHVFDIWYKNTRGYCTHGDNWRHAQY